MDRKIVEYIIISDDRPTVQERVNEYIVKWLEPFWPLEVCLTSYGQLRFTQAMVKYEENSNQ